MDLVRNLKTIPSGKSFRSVIMNDIYVMNKQEFPFDISFT
jgi:hypothetical protein